MKFNDYKTETKLKYMEDVSEYSLELYDTLEKRMKFLLGDIELSNEQEDKIFLAIRDVLEEHCEGDYKHHH
jgi:hypothetical protein